MEGLLVLLGMLIGSAITGFGYWLGRRCRS